MKDNSSIIICSIVRDAEKGLKQNIPVIKQFIRFFGNYTIIIFENDSRDGTKKVLKEWQSEDPDHIHVYMEDGVFNATIPKSGDVSCNPFFSEKRIAKMVYLRNQYLDKIDTLCLFADYLMVVDLDVAKLDLNSILSSFESKVKWDAVTSFGYSLSPRLRSRYHDTYALTELGDEDNPQTENKIKKLADKYGHLKKSDDWIRVFSAFGGLAIYKYDAIKGIRYQLLENDDPRVQVRCEHFSIYKQMKERGYDNIYINPAMVLKYQNLTWKIVFNSIKRKFGLA